MRKWPGRWRLDVAGWRELVAYWKQENEVNCVVSISSSRDQTKKARNHARFTWPSHNTHTQILPALYTNSRKQTTAWILNSPFFSQSPIFFLSMWHTHLLLLPIILFPSDLFLQLSSFFLDSIFVLSPNITSDRLCYVMSWRHCSTRVCAAPLFFVWLSFSSSFSVIVWFDSVALRFDPPVYSPPTYTLSSYGTELNFDSPSVYLIEFRNALVVAVYFVSAYSPIIPPFGLSTLLASED
jgi:hypothetical protein